jgi:hypothetical protein
MSAHGGAVSLATKIRGARKDPKSRVSGCMFPPIIPSPTAREHPPCANDICDVYFEDRRMQAEVQLCCTRCLQWLYDRPLDPSWILCRPPLDQSAGVCFVKRKVESSIPPGSNFHPTYLTGRATKGTWGNLGRQKEKEMIFHKWISSDGSEMVPTTDVKINLTLPYLYCSIHKP